MEKNPGDDPVSNFESLWQTANDKYSFFEYKGIDWDAVYDEYRPRVYDGMTNYQLFQVLKEMLNELRDGHVNLISPFNISVFDIDLLAQSILMII